MQQLVAKGPAIFLGRCTGQIFKTEARVPFIHAFVYASNMQDRIERARKVDGIENSRIEAYIKRRDNQRKNYNKFFTDKTWGDRNNYDLMLNTSARGYEGAAAAISAGNTGMVTPKTVNASGKPTNIMMNFAVTAGNMP